MSKSKILILESNAYVSTINLSDLPPVSVRDIDLPFVTEERSLEVLLQNNLSWRKHVSHISRKVHDTLHALKYHKNALSIEVKIKLVKLLLFHHTLTTAAWFIMDSPTTLILVFSGWSMCD